LKLFSFSAWNALHAFKVSVEKSAVILIGLPLYVICFFFLTAFFNAHDSQVWSFVGFGEFLHIPFTGLELFDQ
jgi:hypothetical protein